MSGVVERVDCKYQRRLTSASDGNPVRQHTARKISVGEKIIFKQFRLQKQFLSLENLRRPGSSVGKHWRTDVAVPDTSPV